MMPLITLLLVMTSLYMRLRELARIPKWLIEKSKIFDYAYTCRMDVRTKGGNMSAIIELKDVNLGYTASQTMALEDVNLVIPRGSRTAIVGPNGAGKSSLFKVILGLEKPDTGQVRMLGQEAGLERLIANLSIWTGSLYSAG